MTSEKLEPDDATLESHGTAAERDIDVIEEHIPQRMEGELGSFAEHVVPMGGRMVREMGEIADEMATEDQAEDRLLAGIERAVTEQPSAVGDGVDLTAIKGVEPDFDPAAFRTIARETFLKVREARSTEREQEDDGLVKPLLERRIDDEILSDAAAHHRHVLVGLEVAEATIVSATVDQSREKISVRFVALAEHIERDDATGTVLSDDGSAHRFTEVWQFERNPAVDSSATDVQHVASFDSDGWLFAHRGWVVTDIQPPDA
jgi:hypothetical protein